MRGLTVLLLLAFAPSGAHGQARRPAAAPAWARVARTRELTWYVDTARIETSGFQAATVWLRYDYPRPEPLPSDHSKQFSRIELHERLDCPRQVATDLFMRLLDGDRLVAQPVPHMGPRSFDAHPISGLLRITCDILEARRRGRLRLMIETLQRAPVPRG